MKRHVRAVLALLARVAGSLAAVAGNIAPPPAADEVSAVELAQWIRDRRPGLRNLGYGGILCKGCRRNH